MDGDAAGDAGFHRQVDARGYGVVPDLGTAQRDHSLLAVTTDLPAAMAASDDVSGGGGIADQLRDDAGLRIVQRLVQLEVWIASDGELRESMWRLHAVDFSGKPSSL